MSIKNLSLSVLLAVFAGASTVSAKDFQMLTLQQAKAPMYDLKDEAGKQTYYQLMHAKIGKKMQELSKFAKNGSTNEKELAKGAGVSVKLGENNYNIHINFPNGAQGGRSYGWTSGQVGDWSDAMYLQNLEKVVSEGSEKEQAAFYELIIRMLGASDSKGIESLQRQSQRVAANFLAIYTAEQYRAMVPQPSMNWDDALLEVTMLGAFHGGQSKFKMMYLGKFTDETRVQDSGVYNRGRPGPLFPQADEKEAEMKDYWQFSANPTSKQSGINITRNDFEKMGMAITAFESKARNKNLAKIQAVVGGDKTNVIAAISKYFTTGRANVKATSALAKDVAAFMMDIRNDADKISDSLK